MAKSQYNGDSPFPSPFSEHPGMSGGHETIPIKPAFDDVTECYRKPRMTWPARGIDVASATVGNQSQQPPG